MAKFYAFFGGSKTGLGTVGYEQVDGDTSVVARTTTGVVEVGRGVYMVELVNGITSPTSGLLWDTGETTPVPAFEDMKQDLEIKILRNRRETNPTTGVQTLYDDDGTTVLLTGNIWENIAASQAYRGEGIDRQEPLV